jgi:hypothetical protein
MSNTLIDSCLHARKQQQQQQMNELKHEKTDFLMDFSIHRRDRVRLKSIATDVSYTNGSVSKVNNIATTFRYVYCS